MMHASTRICSAATLWTPRPSGISVSSYRTSSSCGCSPAPAARAGVLTDWLLAAIAWLTVVFGPSVGALDFEMQFLPCHHEPVSWSQRARILLDILILLWLWPSILCSIDDRRGVWQLIFAVLGVFGVLLAVFCVFIATFPGENFYRNVLARAMIIPVPARYFREEQHRSESPTLPNICFRDLLTKSTASRQVGSRTRLCCRIRTSLTTVSWLSTAPTWTARPCHHGGAHGPCQRVAET